MENSRSIDVTNLDSEHRRAFEDAMGIPLQANQRLIIRVTEVEAGPQTQTVPRPAQTLEDWAKVYEGLTDEQVEEIDVAIKTRANLTRNLP